MKHLMLSCIFLLQIPKTTKITLQCVVNHTYNPDQELFHFRTASVNLGTTSNKSPTTP